MPAAGPPTLEFPARGSRPKTETGETSANHAGRRASTPEIPGPRFALGNRNQRDERESCRPPGPSHFPRPNPKTPGGSPAFLLIFLSSYPLIRVFIPADSGRFPRILPGTLSAAEALLRCPLRGWPPRSAEAPDRAGTSAGGTNRCGRSNRN